MAKQAPHDVLSECLGRWERGQGGVEELLAQHPELRRELEPLLQLAVQLRSLPRAQAPARLRQDPLWRRSPRPTAQSGAPVSLPQFAAGRAARPASAALEPHDALAECLERWERGDGGVDELLAQNAAIVPLVELAVELWSTPPVQAPARLRQDPLWRRATAPAAAAEPPTGPTSLPLWAAARQDAVAPAARLADKAHASRHRLIVALSRLAAGVGSVGLAVLLAGGLATSSATSLPDEPLYPVKRLVEDAQLAVAPPEARLEIRLQRVQERMKETREMAEHGSAAVVASLATDYVREVDAVRTELQNPRGQTPVSDQVSRVITRLEANEQMLGAMVDRVPEPARPALARAVEVSRPESVAPIEVPVVRERVVAPAASEPDRVAPPPAVAAEPQRIAPVAVPTFGVSGPASVSLPNPRSAARESAGGSPAAPAAPRVSVPGGAAPALLPGASSPASRGAPASSGPQSITGSGTSAGGPPSTTAAGAAAPGPPSASGGAGTSPPSTTSGAGTSPPSVTGGVGTSPPSTTGGASTSPQSTTGGSAAADRPQSTTAGGATSAGPPSTTGSASGTGPSSTTGSGPTGASPAAPNTLSREAAPPLGQPAPAAPAAPAAPPSQAAPPTASPTPVYQLLPPVGGPPTAPAPAPTRTP